MRGQHLPRVGADRRRRRLRRPGADRGCSSAYAGADPRIKFKPLAENAGISGATNAGLALCEGEFVGFLDHDDTLTPDALLRVAQALAADPELDVVYSDSDKLTVDGRPRRPVPEARLVAGLRARRDVHRPPAGRPHLGRRGRRGLRLGLRQDPGLRVHAAGLRAHRPDPPHPADPLPLAGDPGQHRRRRRRKVRRRRSCRRGRSPPTSSGSACRRARRRTRRSRTGRCWRRANGSAPQPTVSVVIVAAPRRAVSTRSARCWRALLASDDVDREYGPEGVERAIGRRARASRAAPRQQRRRRRGRGRVPRSSSPPTTEIVDAGLARAARSSTPRCRASPRSGRCWSAPTARSSRPGSRSACATRRRRCCAGFDADGDGYYGALPCAREVSALSAECLLVAAGRLRARAAASTSSTPPNTRTSTSASGSRAQRPQVRLRAAAARRHPPHERRAAGRQRHRRPRPLRRLLVRRAARAATPTSTAASPASGPTSSPPAGASRSTAAVAALRQRDEGRLRLLRAARRQQRDPGLPLRQRADRAGLGGDRWPGVGDPAGSRRVGEPLFECISHDDARPQAGRGPARPGEETIVIGWTPRERVRRHDDGPGRAARRPLRDPPRGQRGATCSSRSPGCPLEELQRLPLRGSRTAWRRRT